jgi:hypothetical protein
MFFILRVNKALVAFDTESMFANRISPALPLITQLVIVVEETTLPVERAGLVPIMLFETVGTAVPVAIFHTSNVIVGLEPAQAIPQPVISKSNGIITEPTIPVVTELVFVKSPLPNEICLVCIEAMFLI